MNYVLIIEINFALKKEPKTELTKMEFGVDELGLEPNPRRCDDLQKKSLNKYKFISKTHVFVELRFSELKSSQNGNNIIYSALDLLIIIKC